MSHLAAATLGTDIADQGSNPKEKISCPKCGNQAQMDGIGIGMHHRQRKRIHVCLYCSRVNPKTYSTFNDWKKHLMDTHLTCLPKCDLLMEAEYAAGFKLDTWQRLYELEGNKVDPS